VIRQARNVASDVFVQDAWARGQPLHVHGWVYSLANGLIRDLNVTMGCPGRHRTPRLIFSHRMSERSSALRLPIEQ